jgi:redox-sensitive bicupin YhaK (pirin superfamily)
MNSMEANRIYKSNERGAIESEIFSRYSTFNFDDYRNDSCLPFGTLKVLNDETLCAGNKILRHVEEYTDIIIIPLSGSIIYKDSLTNRTIVETEQVGIFSVQEGMAYELINLYEKAKVNYLQLWIAAETDRFIRQAKQKDFNYEGKNSLFPVFTGRDSNTSGLKVNSEASGYLGVFDKKVDGDYILKNPKNGLFVFVISGAFEFEGRLLQSRDGLSLTGIRKAAFEALSQNATMLLLEVPLK